MFFKMLINRFASLFKYSIAFTPWGFHSALSFAKKETAVFKKLVNDPCEENAVEYIELRKTRPKFSLTYVNRPEVWASLREKWNIINHSDRISYEMKKAVMEDLVHQGLHLNNQRIIDNYKHSSNING